MANNLLPLLFVGGAAVLLSSKKKKKKKSGSGNPGSISGNFGDYANADPAAVDFANAQAEINKYPTQVWVFVDPKQKQRVAELRSMLKTAAAQRPDMGFALIGYQVFIPEMADQAKLVIDTWELRSNTDEVLSEGVVTASDFRTVLHGLTTALTPGVPDPLDTGACDPLNPAPAGFICVDRGGQWVLEPVATEIPPGPSGPPAEELARRQGVLTSIGYTDGDLQRNTAAFQTDWSSFVASTHRLNANWIPKNPVYREIPANGVWNAATNEASQLAAAKFTTESASKGIYVDALDRDVFGWREMVAGLATVQEMPSWTVAEMKSRLPRIHVHNDRAELDAQEEKDIAFRSDIHRIALLIGNFSGLSNNAQQALEEWAQDNWAGWTVQIAPILPGDADLSGQPYGATVWRGDAPDGGDWLQFSSDLIYKDASKWSYDDLYNALEVAKLPLSEIS